MVCFDSTAGSKSGLLSSCDVMSVVNVAVVPPPVTAAELGAKVLPVHATDVMFPEWVIIDSAVTLHVPDRVGFAGAPTVRAYDVITTWFAEASEH